MSALTRLMTLGRERPRNARLVDEANAAVTELRRALSDGRRALPIVGE